MSWRTVKLGEVAEIERDGIAPEEIVAGTAYLGLEHIEAGGRILSSVPVANGELASTKFRFGPNHLLYGKLRPYLAKIALPDFSGICSTDIVPVRPGDGIDKRYLAYFLRQPSMVAYASSRATGINLPRLSPKSLADFEIPLSPLPEQKRIAAILDQADDLRWKRQAVASELERLREASLSKACRLSTRSVSLSSLFIDIKMGPFGSLLHKADYVDNGVPLINPMHINGGRIQPDPAFSVSQVTAKALSGYQLNPDDIIIGRRGEMGRSALVLPEHAGMLCGTGAMRLRIDRGLSLPEFMADFLSHPRTVRELENAASGVTMLNLSSKSFDKITVKFPPLDAQAAYVKTKTEISKKKKALEVGVALADSLFASLQHRAFRGEL